jgi:Cu+-exporting ATPase
MPTRRKAQEGARHHVPFGSSVDGVAATVNFATETARVSFPASVSTGDLISVIEQVRYTAAQPAPRQAASAGLGAVAGASGADEADKLRQLLVSLTLAIPVVVLAMVPALQFRSWQWLSLALASPEAVWNARPFHRAAPAVSWPGWCNQGEAPCVLSRCGCRGR